ncbi:MAG TPA: FHA domain-containing protein [Rudaea sp.]|jgi:pSer/pThr/pTyr-binding forkhead associated (FHA) protein
MKLLFPNDEHAPVALVDGTTLVGSDAACGIRLALPGIVSRHCELVADGGHILVRPLTDSAATVLNGRQIVGEATVKPGDLLLFGRIGCRVVSTGVAAPRVAPPAAVNEAGDDMGHTRVRMALPKYLLRGVSGPTFGKIYAVVGTIAVGRNSDSDICIPIDEISRQHARLKNAPSGIVVEDLGSANGTFINDKRVLKPTLLNTGDEVRFDTVRFLLMSTAQEAQLAVAGAAAAPRAAPRSAGLLWLVATLAALVVIALGVLRYLGRI